MDTAALKNNSGILWRFAVLLVLTVIVVLLTVYCLMNGIQTIFTHFYYVPIILAAFWFQKKGLLYSAVMGVFYLACVIILAGYNPLYVIAAVARVVVFIIIAAVVMVLSMRIFSQKGEIEASEKKFRTIWEDILAGIIIVDADTHEIIAVNPEGERMTGFTAEEIIGKPCHNCICPAGKGKCPISDLHMTLDRSERILLTKGGDAVPVLKTVTDTTLDGRHVLIENYVPVPPSTSGGNTK